MDSLEELKAKIDDFSEARDWTQFHSPANLAKSICIESAELLECFQWDEDNFSEEQVKEELADVLNYAIRLASVMNLDIQQIVLDKLQKNARKYPVEKARGRSDKYNKL